MALLGKRRGKDQDIDYSKRAWPREIPETRSDTSDGCFGNRQLRHKTEIGMLQHWRCFLRLVAWCESFCHESRIRVTESFKSRIRRMICAHKTSQGLGWCPKTIIRGRWWWQWDSHSAIVATSDQTFGQQRRSYSGCLGETTRRNIQRLRWPRWQNALARVIVVCHRWRHSSRYI